MEEPDFNDDLYWDLADLNPNAIVYTEYTRAYLGFALKNNKWVACYDINVLEGIVSEDVFMNDEEWINKTLKDLDGKVKVNDIQKAMYRLAFIEGSKRTAELIEPWDSGEHTPIAIHLPKLIQALDQEAQDQRTEEVFKYDGD